MGGPGSGPRPGHGRGGTGRRASLNKTGTPGTRAERNRKWGSFRRGATQHPGGRKATVKGNKRMPAITRKLNREARSTMTRSMRNAMRKK